MKTKILTNTEKIIENADLKIWEKLTEQEQEYFKSVVSSHEGTLECYVGNNKWEQYLETPEWEPTYIFRFIHKLDLSERPKKEYKLPKVGDIFSYNICPFGKDTLFMRISKHVDDKESFYDTDIFRAVCLSDEYKGVVMYISIKEIPGINIHLPRSLNHVDKDYNEIIIF